MTQNKNNKFISLVKKIVQNEIKKFVNEHLQEMVKNKVNEMLAEQFLQSFRDNKSLSDVYTENSNETKTKNTNTNLQEQQRKDFRKKILDKMKSSPEMMMIYEDVEVPSSMSSNIDDDDEGIDPSIFLGPPPQ